MRNYVIALYIRLSVEDFKTESLSIPNQKLILREKAMSLPEWDDSEILEFIDMEHTPKNILLRAVKKGSPATKSRKEAEDCERFLKIQPTLGMLLAEQKGDK